MRRRRDERLDDALEPRLDPPLLVQLALHAEHEPAGQLEPSMTPSPARAETTRPRPTRSTAWWWKLSTSIRSPISSARSVPGTVLTAWRGWTGAGAPVIAASWNARQSRPVGSDG